MRRGRLTEREKTRFVIFSFPMYSDGFFKSNLSSLVYLRFTMYFSGMLDTESLKKNVDASWIVQPLQESYCDNLPLCERERSPINLAL